jgi:Domain of unknown function (DUF4424)
MEYFHMMAKKNSSENLQPIELLMIFSGMVITIAILFSPTGVFANDSAAAFGAGGIELVKNEHIRMLEEILEISPKKIRVEYRFLNESDKDIDTTVAFPLPPEYRVSNFFVPGGDPAMILKSFKVLVNGNSVTTRIVQKAVIGHRDITEELSKLGLSDEEIFFDIAFEDLESFLSKHQKLREKYGDWWRVSRTLFWKMTFPVGKEIVVEHEYAPVQGFGYFPWTDRENFFGEKNTERFKGLEKLWDQFSGKPDKDADCLDEGTKRAIENRVKMAVLKGAGLVYVGYADVEYILSTGRNWKGPIGEFTLRLVKEKPDQFVSVCFPGQPKKISPTVYEFYQKDFVPQDDLDVYFYTVSPEMLNP